MSRGFGCGKGNGAQTWNRTRDTRIFNPLIGFILLAMEGSEEITVYISVYIYYNIPLKRG